MREIQFPSMRNEVVYALASLSDRAYQQRVWIDRIMPTPTFHDDLDLNVHILFDDTDVCLHPERWVGQVLYPAEVEPLHDLGEVLDATIDDLGDAPDTDYLADPRWDKVIRLARVALVTMTGRSPDQVLAELLNP